MAILTGKVEKGLGYASGRIERCKSLLKEYGMEFPPFRLGTINIKLDSLFKTPAGHIYRTIFIPREEIDLVDQNVHNEDWWLVHVNKINGKDRAAWIYKTSTNYHGNSVIEILAHDIGPEATIGESISLEIVNE